MAVSRRVDRAGLSRVVWIIVATAVFFIIAAIGTSIFQGKALWFEEQAATVLQQSFNDIADLGPLGGGGGE